MAHVESEGMIRSNQAVYMDRAEGVSRPAEGITAATACGVVAFAQADSLEEPRASPLLLGTGLQNQVEVERRS